MIILGPDITITGESEGKLLLVSVDYTGSVGLTASRSELGISPIEVSLAPGTSAEIVVSSRNLQDYRVTATELSGTDTTYADVSFRSKYGFGRLSPRELEVEIHKCIEQIDVRPSFVRVKEDETGYIDVTADRRFWLGLQDWTHGELFGSYDVRYRLLVGWLTSRAPERSRVGDDDFSLLRNALRDYPWPQGMAGIDLVEGNVIASGDHEVVLHEYYINATIWYK